MIDGTLSEIGIEMLLAGAKFGPQLELVDVGDRSGLGVPDEVFAKALLAEALEEGRLSWAHVLVEEVAEALDAPTLEALRAELVQVAAVAARWIDALDARDDR